MYIVLHYLVPSVGYTVPCCCALIDKLSTQIRAEASYPYREIDISITLLCNQIQPTFGQYSMFGSPSANRAQIQRNQDLSVEGLGELDVNCSICLQPMEDRTVIPKCSHDFCFDCLITWTGTCRLQTDLGFSADLHNVNQRNRVAALYAHRQLETMSSTTYRRGLTTVNITSLH